MVDDLRIWSLRIQSAGRFTLPPFRGPLIRGILGAALFDQLGHAAANALFRGGGPPPFRLDTPVGPVEELHAGDTWQLRLVTFDPGVEEPLLDALETALAVGLGDARVPQEVLGVVTLAHGGENPSSHSPELSPDFDGRGREIFRMGGVRVRLASPVELKRRDEVIARPLLLDLLHGARHRVRALGIDASTLPRFEDEVEQVPGRAREYHHRRHSAAQGRDYTLSGVVGSLAARPTEAQAAWLALAEVLGLGSDTAQGKGVIRVEPL